MNKGKILKVRHGHDANCSSYAYMGYILVAFLGYAALLCALVATQTALRARKWAGEPWLGKAKIGLWVLPHLVGIGLLLVTAFESGAMNYGSSVCVGGLVLVMLITMGVGVFKIQAAHGVHAADELCPECGRPTAAEPECPWCGANLAGHTRLPAS